VKSGSTANTAAGGPLDGVTVTILMPTSGSARMYSWRWRATTRAKARIWDPLIKSLTLHHYFNGLAVNQMALRSNEINALHINCKSHLCSVRLGERPLCARSVANPLLWNFEQREAMIVRVLRS
jgi:hypothetical protein